jgi:nucleoside-diphosphate-sugar epimerase
MVQERVLITGAGGNMGQMLRERLATPGRTLRLLNRSPVTPAGPGEAVETISASVTDFSAVLDACEGVDAVIHLGGLSGEAPFEDILHTNVLGSHHVLEAARRQGVRKVLLASSNHAVGYFSRDDAPADGLPADLPPRPDSYYGWSKTAVESLGRLYADTYPIDVYCLRIGSCFDVPTNVRHLSTWMSPDDSARLMNACLRTDNGGFHVVWGVSANTRRWWSLKAGEQIGYQPVDDAEVFAADLIDRLGEAELSDPVHHLVGGELCASPLGTAMSLAPVTATPDA